MKTKEVTKEHSAINLSLVFLFSMFYKFMSSQRLNPFISVNGMCNGFDQESGIRKLQPVGGCLF